MLKNVKKHIYANIYKNITKINANKPQQRKYENMQKRKNAKTQILKYEQTQERKYDNMQKYKNNKRKYENTRNKNKNANM